MGLSMSKRNQALLGILLLVVLWIGLNTGLLFFNDLLRSDSRRSWFNNSYGSYPMIRIVQPFVSGVGILYLWAKAEHAKNTGIAWLGFALLVLATLIYTLAVPAPEHLRGEPPKRLPPEVCEIHKTSPLCRKHQ